MHAESPGPRLWLVVPCYNEAGRLPRRAFLDFAACSPQAVLLFVDDGSTDATSQVLHDLAASANGRARVLPLARNAGKAEAVRRGVMAALEAGPSLVGFWDADLATPLDAVRAFVDVLDVNPDVEIVMGARVQLLGREVQRRPARHYTGRIFATAASLALGLPVYDTQCGAKIFRASEAIVRAFREPFRSSWAFDVEILARYIAAVGRQRAAQSIYELPLARWNDVPGSKVKLWHGMRAIWDLARIRRETRPTRGPR